METDKITPIQKYAIWRNVHIKHMTSMMNIQFAKHATRNVLLTIS